jgi:hypothetical protein
MKSKLTYYFIKKGLLLPAFLGVILFTWLNPYNQNSLETRSDSLPENSDSKSELLEIHALMRQNKQQEAFSLATAGLKENSSKPIAEFVRAFELLQSPEPLLQSLHQDILAAILLNRYSGTISSDTLMNRLIIHSIRNNREAVVAAIMEKKMEQTRKDRDEEMQRVAEELEMLKEANSYVQSVYLNY